MRWLVPTVVVGMIVSMAASLGEAASCSGNACQEVALESQGGCVWLRSRSDLRVDVTVRLADGAIDVTLEPTSKAKADQREARRAAAEAAAKKGPSPNLCRRALSSEETRNRLRAQGQSIPASPEIQGVADQCRRAAATQSDETAFHDYKFEPLLPSSKGTPVYRKRLARGTGCVARLEDLELLRDLHDLRAQAGELDQADEPARLREAGGCHPLRGRLQVRDTRPTPPLVTG